MRLTTKEAKGQTRANAFGTTGFDSKQFKKKAKHLD
jgi:hypothetical protein